MGPSKLLIAALAGEEEKVKHLLTFGVSPNQDIFLQGSPVNCAIASGNLGAVKMLCRHGACFSFTDGYGVAPIHTSAIYSRYEITEWLLEAQQVGDLDVNLLSRVGKTALDYALEEGNVQIIQLLRKHGAKTATEMNSVKRKGASVAPVL